MDRDPELDALMAGLIDHRNDCRRVGMGDWAEGMQRVIDAMHKHPYFKEKRRAALAEMMRMDEESRPRNE